MTNKRKILMHMDVVTKETNEGIIYWDTLNNEKLKDGDIIVSQIGRSVNIEIIQYGRIVDLFP